MISSTLGLTACGGSTMSSPTATLAPPTVTVEPTPEPTGTPSDTTGGWQLFTSDDGEFSVLFPGEPKQSSNTLNTELGELTLHNFGYVASEGVDYNASYNDYPADKVSEDSKDLLDGVLSGVGKTNTLVTQQTTTQQGHPAVVAEFEAPGSNYIYYKGVMFKNRLYQLAVVGSSDNKETYKPDAMKFIDSFELTNP
jgi:hypothetical protein